MADANPIRNVSDTAALGRDLPRDGKRAARRDLPATPTRAASAAHADRPSSKRLPSGFVDELADRRAHGGHGRDRPAPACEPGAKTVLNLAAGLDARAVSPRRCPPTLRWLHVDLPEMVDYFRRPHGRRNAAAADVEFIPADLRERRHAPRSVRDTPPEQGPVLVITEGLLIYLEAEHVADTRAPTCTTSRRRAGG